MASLIPLVAWRRLLPCAISLFAAACTPLYDSAGSDGGAADSAAASDASSALDATAKLDASAASDAAAFDFIDDFERPNSLNVGNGWFAKNPPAFVIRGGQLEKETTAATYIDNFLVRPAAEDRLNVEARVEFRMPSDAATPQLYVRLQRDQVAVTGRATGYFIYSDPPLAGRLRQLTIARHNGASYTNLKSVDLRESLGSNGVYRFTLSAADMQGVVAGVRIAGTLEKQVAGAFVPLQDLEYDDSSNERIGTAGGTGVSGRPAAGPIYDNFTWRQLR